MGNAAAIIDNNQHCVELRNKLMVAGFPNTSVAPNKKGKGYRLVCKNCNQHLMNDLAREVGGRLDK